MRSELLTGQNSAAGRDDDRSRPRSIRGCATITEQYDGVTVSPARQSRQRKNHDDIIVFEVMTDKIARRWWIRKALACVPDLESDQRGDQGKSDGICDDDHEIALEDAIADS